VARLRRTLTKPGDRDSGNSRHCIRSNRDILPDFRRMSRKFPTFIIEDCSVRI